MAGKSMRVPVVACGVVAAGGAATQPFSWSAMVLVLIPAVVLLVLAMRSTPERVARTPELRRGMVCWSTLLLAVVALETYAYLRQPDRSQPSHEYPTLSTLLDPALENSPLRFAGWLVWLGVGWWLVTR